MRVSEERYSRDLRRLNLATTLLRHRVRSGLVMQWTGLPDRWLRTLRGREGRGGGGAGAVPASGAAAEGVVGVFSDGGLAQ